MGGSRGARRQPREFHGAFALNRRADLDAIDAASARWRDASGRSPLDLARTPASSHPTHWLISTQVIKLLAFVEAELAKEE